MIGMKLEVKRVVSVARIAENKGRPTEMIDGEEFELDSVWEKKHALNTIVQVDYYHTDCLCFVLVQRSHLIPSTHNFIDD